jgi:hypothetical protein
MSMSPGDGALTWEERFWRRVQKTDGCWFWLGGRGGTTTQPYGVYMLPGQVRKGAHVIAYELLREPIPAGHEIDHLCRNPLCVRPDHLESVTRAENRLRQWKRQTHCKHGHPRTSENTYEYRGHRYCRPCRGSASARHRGRTF